jgi:cyclopropane fatty-acyl-phospholipid synthase-like methyltransferase
MTEYIGKVALNLDYYNGEDLYCDGPVEDELLDIVKSYKPEEYDKVIMQRQKWPILYHLSAIRENCVNWMNINSEAEVLEIGSGCGAVTGALSAKAKNVTCIELSEKRSKINAERHKCCDNISIIVGNFEDIEPELGKFDVVTLIGVLEYGGLYIRADEPYSAFLNTVRRHLKPNGKLVIAIENRLGLKYWAGCKEDHVSRYFESIEGYPHKEGVKTFSHGELDELVRSCGFELIQFYYPYPDYKLPEKIYSDSYLPSKGELEMREMNFDNDRLKLFDECRAFDTVIENGLFREFANSFIVIAEEGV